jgi:hypothetical protein
LLKIINVLVFASASCDGRIYPLPWWSLTLNHLSVVWRALRLVLSDLLLLIALADLPV